MRRNDIIRLRHILDAANEAISFAQGRTREDLDTDRMLVLALVKDIEIIGEAAFKIPSSERDQLKVIPWEDIIAMRHRLVHAYFDIDYDILWQTLQDDLPALVAILKPSFLRRTNEVSVNLSCYHKKEPTRRLFSRLIYYTLTAQCS